MMMSYLVEFFNAKKYRVQPELVKLAGLYEELAKAIEDEIPATGEGAEAIRKLLESRDAAFRAKLQ